ncbi:heavy-metal-associated domain-containing protein [uncultured Jannaschia sp.]|jgi:copper chaperone|uniref:heavy-metal-associated domain-containing protein n=1 Tax=uncultured Jannaschia sp. TaxID=293347 RepID=UPI00262CE14F|nr:heavy-metal-associated domain-containing protein [uncultured Jannaschia sp.]
MKFHVPDMSCGHCRSSIEKAVAAADPTARVSFEPQDRMVQIDTARDEDAMRATLKDAGYDAAPA